MNGITCSAAHRDALWRAYVAQDPDLRRLENRKRRIAHKRTVQIYTRRRRARQIRHMIARACQAIAMGAIGFLVAVGFMALLFCI